jgi:hypothetical protein
LRQQLMQSLFCLTKLINLYFLFLQNLALVICEMTLSSGTKFPISSLMLSVRPGKSPHPEPRTLWENGGL